MADGITSAPRHELVLIGPQGVGKSTLGRLLAERLGLPWVEMDEILARVQPPERGWPRQQQ